MSLLALTRLWGLAVSVRNLTERRGNDRLASLVERSSDVVVLVDADGRISYTSPALKHVLGYERRGMGRPRCRDPRRPGQQRAACRVCGSTCASSVRNRSITLEVSAMHADGERRMMELSAVNLMSNVAVAGTVLTFRDVTANRTLEHQLSYRADHDALTGLANRADFLTTFGDELQGANRPTVMFIDLDDFKTINEGLGHAAGDVLLRSVADRLTIRFEQHVQARRPASAADEFGVLLRRHVDRRGHRIGAAR